jgi:hypothetical protein
MIELNPEQWQAAAQGKPVRVVDPATRDAYILIRAEVYARLEAQPQQCAKWPDLEIPPMVLRSQQAFWHDLPDLLRDVRNHGKWAAYHERKRVALRESDLEAYQECFRRGLKPEEFYVGKLESDPDGGPPWGTLEADWSLFEVTEGNPPGPA